MSIGLGGQRIIRQGMGIGHKACQGLITTHFSLYCITVTIPPVTPKGGGGGGPYPGDAWNKFDNAKDIFQPVEHGIYDPNRIYKDKKEVVVRIEFKNFHTEKIYLVPIQRVNAIVKIINVLNTTKRRITIGVKNLRNVIHNIKISISGLRRKR